MKGFTLIETMLVLALLGLAAAITIPVHLGFQNSNELDVAESVLAGSYRRAQALAQASYSDSSWGVRVETGKIAVFKGSSYEGREPDFDEVFIISSSIEVSGAQEVVFYAFSGEPDATGTTTLAYNDNETRQIHINSKGMVSY